MQNNKLVTADTRSRIYTVDRTFQNVGDRFQYAVAFGMAENIVHGFEAVQIKRQHSKRFTIAARYRIRKTLLEEHAIGQIGECIMPRHMFDLTLGCAFSVRSRTANTSQGRP